MLRPWFAISFALACTLSDPSSTTGDTDDDTADETGTEGPEDNNAACMDTIDNDGNGFVDCADFSCRTSREIVVARACQESLAGGDASADLRCSNGEDDDQDGFSDCADWDCSHNPDVTVCGDGPRLCE